MEHNHYFVERRTDLGWEAAGLGTAFPSEEQAHLWLDQHGWEGERFRVIRVAAEVVIPPAKRQVG
jgi:hypothetical protein